MGWLGVGSVSHLLVHRGVHDSEDKHAGSGDKGGGNHSGKGTIKLDDCVIPACQSTKDMMKLAKQKRKLLQESQSQSQQQSASLQSPSPSPAAPSVPLTQQAASQHTHHHHNPYQSGCPVMREQLGVSTWNLIHTIAAHFPENPTETDQKNIQIFFQSLAHLYPCPHCAEDFQSSVLKNPPEYAPPLLLPSFSFSWSVVPDLERHCLSGAVSCTMMSIRS